MPIVQTYLHKGEADGTWYAASYPHGATRYYDSEDARKKAVDAYIAALRATGDERTGVIDVPTFLSR